MLDILLAIDSLPGDFTRSSTDILGFVEELRNGLDLGVNGAIVTYCVSGGNGRTFHVFFLYDVFQELSVYIQNQYYAGYQLVRLTGIIFNYRGNAPDGTIVPRDNAPDVVIVFSEGYSTVEAQNFIQLIEPRARYVLVLCKCYIHFESKSFLIDKIVVII